jgi:hypothetical protein
MNDLKRKNIFDSIREIQDKIAKVDEKLAGLFARIIDGITRVDDINDSEGSPYHNKGRAIEDFFGNTGNINTIPFGKPTPNCYEDCVAIAMRTFKSTYSFNKIASELKNYYLNCGDVNCRTLVVTDNWDKYVFDRDHKDFFDIFTSKKNKNNIKHTVVIILYGDYGFSIQYLK